METGGSRVAGWERLLGTERAKKGTGPPCCATSPYPRPHPETLAGKGGSSQELGTKFLSGPFLSGVKGWNMRALKIGEKNQTAEKGGQSGLPRRPGGDLGKEVLGTPEP